MKSFLTTRRAVFILGLYPALLTLGALGYMAFEGWTFSEGLYMSLITVSTVGFGEVHPLTHIGKTITGLLILGTLVTTPVLGALLTAWFFENTFQNLFKERRMKQKLDHLNDHILVCGLGRMGMGIGARLEKEGKAFVGLDSDLAVLDSIRTLHPDWLLLHGDASNVELLKQAGVARASTVIAALGSDPDNLYLTLSAQEASPNVKIIARAETENGARRLARVGIQNIVTPIEIGARRISDMILAPHFLEYLDSIDTARGEGIHIYTCPVVDGSKLIGKTLAELEIPNKTQLMVVGVRRKGEKVEYNPRADFRVQQGNQLYLSGPESGMKEFKRIFGV